MIYDLRLKSEIDKLRAKLNFYANNERKVELKLYSPSRSIKHNRYLHLCLNAFAIEYGEKMDYVKQEIFKKMVNPDVFRSEYVNPKTGEVREDWRSTAGLTDAELSRCIDRFKDFAVQELGLLLPDSSDKVEVERLEIHVKNNQYW